LRVIRPAAWQVRANRLYRYVLREARRLQGFTTSTPRADDLDDELAAAVHGELARMPFPLRSMARAVATLSLSVAGSLSLLGLVLAAVCPPVRRSLFPPDIAANAPWHASSAWPGTAVSGVGPSAPSSLFFHTLLEDNPWLIVDLGKETEIGKVRVKNRPDCCQDRVIPLNVEVPDGQGGWRLICQRRAPFSSWACEPKDVRTRQLRLRVPGRTTFHLQQVQVFP
jgi:hypothetical protein